MTTWQHLVNAMLIGLYLFGTLLTGLAVLLLGAWWWVKSHEVMEREPWVFITFWSLSVLACCFVVGLILEFGG